MDNDKAKKIIESLLYMTDHPLNPKEIVEVLEAKAFGVKEVTEILEGMKTSFLESDSGLCLFNVAGGYQIATRPEMAQWVRKLYKERLTVRLSISALETLSIIAYKQPIARAEIEQIRGVEASGVMDTLVERRLIKVVGRKETIGRPLLFGTTIEFLRQFGLNHLADLPDLKSIQPKPDSALGIPDETVLSSTGEYDSAAAELESSAEKESAPSAVAVLEREENPSTESQTLPSVDDIAEADAPLNTEEPNQN